MNVKNLCVASSGLAALLLAGSASAGEWVLSVDPQGGNRVEVFATFHGDGATEEAQLDVKLNGAFAVESVEKLIPGSVCVASVEKNILRAVPPSGAGVGLPKGAHDTCVFTLRFLQKSMVADFSSQFDVSFTECASSKGIDVSCTSAVKQLKGTGRGTDKTAEK
ncbi:hypothetical protein [Pseudomarimonas arenosa]|uniref:Uncharacterized protein n=1 Tax=Pseudomarimonas arenosa TaxID=2774145 RepID=A0AAW3ZP93_9GAMM|nr:hypothetical protein [Pseudomarimonas arenosa]MBD8527330.1 hypothetical protein [Pseudomarimonas arenosa]